MTRLDGVLDSQGRGELARQLADHVLGVVEKRAEALIVSSDPSVLSWASSRGVASLADPGSGLDAAASVGILRAVGGRWAVLHADLPYLGDGDLKLAFGAAEETVLSPTHDGGTSLIVASGPDFPFAYGLGSFRRHLASRPAARVVVRSGLALDLDLPRDLVRYQMVMT